MNLLQILFLVLGLFMALLLVKSLLPKRTKDRLCVLCGAVSLTWFFLLILSWVGRFENKALVALLMGTSVTGLYYLADAKLERLRLFRLPFFLTLLMIAYSLVAPEEMSVGPYFLLLALWTFFGLVHTYRQNSNVKRLVDKLVECCKRW